MSSTRSGLPRFNKTDNCQKAMVECLHRTEVSMDRRIHHSSATLVATQDQVGAGLEPEVVMATTKGRDIDVASARYPSPRGNETSTHRPADETLSALSPWRQASNLLYMAKYKYIGQVYLNLRVKRYRPRSGNSISIGPHV